MISNTVHIQIVGVDHLVYEPFLYIKYYVINIASELIDAFILIGFVLFGRRMEDNLIVYSSGRLLRHIAEESSDVSLNPFG